MEDIIKSAREIGKKIQESNEYIKFGIARQASDDDEELQNLIGEFNLKRMAISNETSKSDKNEEKLQQYNKELRECYDKIMTNEHMTAYNSAKKELDLLVARVTAIIAQSAEGDDPETTDYTPSCSGSCSTCGGCG